jgi:hypothetical protein
MQGGQKIVLFNPKRASLRDTFWTQVSEDSKSTDADHATANPLIYSTFSQAGISETLLFHNVKQFLG